VWVQWCLCYLTDEDCIAFFRRAALSLREARDSKQGLLVVKENVHTVGMLKADSISRPEAVFKSIFESAGLEIIERGLVRGMPLDIETVVYWVLKKKAENLQEITEAKSTLQENSNSAGKYSFFKFTESKRAQFMNANPGLGKVEINRLMVEQWNKMTCEER
jgi:hypothetical protein